LKLEKRQIAAYRYAAFLGIVEYLPILHSVIFAPPGSFFFCRRGS